MKNLFVLLTIVAMTSTVAFANINDGFRDSHNSRKATVAEALKMNDDSYVTVKGNISKRLSDDRYLFKDSTGTITVEIDNDRWSGISADTTDTLELSGEIEKKNNYTRLDVDQVRKASK